MPDQPPVTIERIESVAPDQASLKAARKLLNPGKWPEMHIDSEGRLMWGACQGSGSSAYRVAVEISDLGAKCSCPSRKFPCKHAIALMWWRSDQPDRFTASEVPQWIHDWQGRRRRATPTAKTSQDGGTNKATGEAKSLAKAMKDEPARVKDPQRAKQQKERNLKAREASILAGLVELDIWIYDQIHRGLAGFGSEVRESCRVMSQRLVDAKAGGLAVRVESLSAHYFRIPEAQRHDLVVRTLGELHLLAQAYRNQSRLPTALVEDVRSLVGWNRTREELLAIPGAERARGDWTVLATRSETQPDRLVRVETWLVLPEADALRFAVLLDFHPVSSASRAGPGLIPGQKLTAELVFYPSATPIRAQVVEQIPQGDAAQPPQPTGGLAEALATFDRNLAINPWLSAVPVAAKAVEVGLDAAGDPWARSIEGEAAVRLVGKGAEVLAGVEDVSLFGCYNGRELELLCAQTALGPWWGSA